MAATSAFAGALVGILFLIAAMSKLLNPRAFTQAVAAYRLMPTSYTLIVGVSLPLIE